MSGPSNADPPEPGQGDPPPSEAAPAVAAAPPAEPPPAAAADGGDGPPPPPPPGDGEPPDGEASPYANGHPSPDNVRVDEVIFRRDLHEVFLLIDFISGRADKNLHDLELPNPEAATTPPDPTHKATLSPGEVVENISMLGYPPDPNPVTRSKGAALLLLAKDKLTELATPARGLTIGYTAMFVGSMKDLKAAKARDEGIATTPRRFMRNPSNARVTLAFVAFGTFIRHVIAFKRVFRLLIAFAFLWLFLTILTYWDVAIGRAILQRIDQFTAPQTELLGHAGFAPDACAKGTPGQPTSVDCQKWNVANDGIARAHHDLADLVLCDGSFCGVLHVLRWGFVLCGLEDQLRTETQSAKPPDPGKPDLLDQSLRSVVTVFSTYVLSMMFGLLGTLIAVIRAIQNKVRDSVLGPRDLVLSLIGLPMGLVAGVAVGLFFSPSSTQISGAIGEVSLSASGLGFLAGYGAEKFFTFLDSLLMRVFPANVANNGAPPVAS